MLKSFHIEEIKSDEMQLIYTGISNNGLVVFKEEDQ